MQWAWSVLYCYLVACPALQHFFTLSHKWHDFRKSYSTKNACFYFLYNFWLKHPSFYKKFSKIWLKMGIGLHVKYPLFLTDSNGTWIFSTVSRKTLKHQIWWKFVQWEPNCSTWTDRQTAGKAVIVAFRSFAKVPKNCNFIYTSLYATGVYCLLPCISYRYYPPRTRFTVQYQVPLRKQRQY